MLEPRIASDSESPPTETLSAAEQRVDRLRRSAGLFAGPLLFAALLLFPLPLPDPAAGRLAAVLGLVLVWWMTEAVPIPVTSLLGPALAVVLGIGSAAETFAPFGDPIVFLFLGSFLLAEAMAASGLDRRIALAVLARPAVAASPTRILVAFGVLTAGISGWLNNTATTAIVFPIALSVLAALARAKGPGTDPRRLRWGTALMLTVGYAASIGGMATPVGTAPNMITLGQLEALAGVRIPFFHFLVVGTPVALVMLALLLGWLRFALPPDVPPPARTALLEGDASRAGPLSRRERNVLAVFALTVAAWVAPGLLAVVLGPEAPLVARLDALLPEPVVAVLGAGLLFVLPVDWAARRFTLEWHEAARIDWGTLLLFGGGLALGGAMFRTGLAEALGAGLVAWTGSHSLPALTFLFAWVALLLTETTSNTATATMLAPLVIASAQAAGVSPVPPALAVALMSSMGFMLPVSTPPNAIVYGSGCIPILAMARNGLVLDLASALLVPAMVLASCRLLGFD
ncbi:MAG: SLC13 family permease [Deltaproteobacteria bacterium]|nr:SLC13 family permease [Deltaproteobacteria bacterium]